MELAIQVGQAAAQLRDEFARFLRSVRRAPRMRVVPSRPPAQGRREATRGFLKFGFRPVRSIRQAHKRLRLRSQKECLKVALGGTDLVEEVTQPPPDRIGRLRR